MVRELPVAPESWQAWEDPSVPVRIGASACVLGDPVRFDGGHQRSRFVTDVLGSFAEFVRVCPEVEMGLPVPRASVRLVQEPGQERPRLVDPRDGKDHTAAAEAHARRRVEQLRTLDLDGYVLKKDSPSCGMARVRAYYDNGHVHHRKAQGVFARELQERFPELPVEEDGRLNDPRLRESFVERVWCRNRWRALCAGGRTPARLVAFHSAHKILLGVHDDVAYRELGRLVARAGELELDELFRAYEQGFFACLRTLASPGRHVNAMQHVLGHVSDRLSPEERQGVLRSLEDYRAGHLPLLAPMGLLRFLLERGGTHWAQAQVYLCPAPKELMARLV